MRNIVYQSTLPISYPLPICAASLPGALLPDPDNVAARQPSRHRIVAALPLPGRPFRSLCRSFSRLPWPVFPAELFDSMRNIVYQSTLPISYPLPILMRA